MRSAIKSDNPTMFVNHARLMDIEGDVPEGDYTIPLGKADIKRKGSDVTVVATSYVVQTALAAAEILAKAGIEVEVLDPRTLVPFDRDAVLQSVGRTGRLVIADETNLSCGVASEISAIVAEHGFKSLRAPIRGWRGPISRRRSARHSNRPSHPVPIRSATRYAEP